MPLGLLEDGARNFLTQRNVRLETLETSCAQGRKAKTELRDISEYLDELILSFIYP